MENAVILHGRPDKDEYYDPSLPSESNAHWLPWIQRQLFIRDIAAQTPEMPHSWNPDYSTWKTEFERYDLTSQTLLVGHSCGGGFLLRWLSENTITVGKVVLVAPWLDPDRTLETGFFDFKLDTNLVERTADLVIFHSDDDLQSVQKSVQTIQEAIQTVRYREFHNYGHFCLRDLGHSEFPELLEELLTDP